MVNSKVAARTVTADTRATYLSHVAQAGLAALLGLFLFAAVGFAQPSAIHNAAHDSRHGIAVPCH